MAGRVLKSLALALAALGLSALPAMAGAKLPTATLSPLGPETSVPFGWVDFCQRYSAECDDGDRAPQAIDLTPAAMRKIEGVNALVNNKIEPVSDAEHAGAPDAWDYPTDGKGDCEDYALLKRRVLMEAGFPRAALLLAVVKDEHGDGHAVLMARTNRGDFVLDNLADEVKPWSQTSYRFVKRQSQENQNVWVAVGAPTSAPMYVAK
ncbi:transglutaminase-like cysteine peptidase [Methylocystis parvus OBBP]|uniref:Transglutaminase-like cysteine peptidase n=1 Tax=Methylocystis parvus TaxID=134 RepID=A0A6B8MDZ6_9HYPH|nr:transglutaminase-like cysteine peptidase [Methylocystis parvus]QGM99513.1 transglutaminase-like cysteine peptidase [Methylocystis parvus]WBK02134.1 transglutaminase-like cysteine peptidase [Methylocystis parvus OBBP]